MQTMISAAHTSTKMLISTMYTNNTHCYFTLYTNKSYLSFTFVMKEKANNQRIKERIMWQLKPTTINEKEKDTQRTEWQK